MHRVVPVKISLSVGYEIRHHTQESWFGFVRVLQNLGRFKHRSWIEKLNYSRMHLLNIMKKYASAKELHSIRYWYCFQAHPNLVLTYNGNRVGDEDNQQPEGFLPGQSVYLIVTDRRQKKESSNQRSALYSTCCSCILVYLQISTTEIQNMSPKKWEV